MKHPDQNEAARRALCLGALVMRGKFESIATSGSPEMMAVHEELSTQLNMWIADEGLIPAQTSFEMPAVCKALGSWTDAELATAGWRANSLGVILWALSQFDELPHWDIQFTPQETIKTLNLFSPIQAFLDKVSLRPADEIEHARRVAELWQWRAQVRSLEDWGADSGPGEGAGTRPAGGAGRGREKADEKVHQVAADALKRGDVAELIDGDLPLFGKSYSALSKDEFSEAASIARERLHALNWLCGFASDWDAVPTEADENNFLA